MTRCRPTRRAASGGGATLSVVSDAWVFRIGEAFPADDPVARFVTVLAMMSNDFVRSIEPLVDIDDDEPDAQGRHLALFRYQAGILHEAAKFLVESRRRFPEIDAFVGGLSDDARGLYDEIVGVDERSAVGADGWLRAHRDRTFHYPSLHPDKARAGKEEVMNALVEAAGTVSRIDSSDRFLGTRFSFADEIVAQWVPALLAPEEVEALRRAVLAIPNLAIAAVEAYAATRPPGTFERGA